MNPNIKLYAAPMEGLTGFAWRKAHSQVFGNESNVFGGADKYFTPFVVANQTHKFKTKELRDLTQDEEKLVPQVLTDKAEHFIWAAGELKAMGYNEINLNLGCPSSTVVTRGKGSGALRDLSKLDEMLDQIFSSVSCSDMEVSIKTRAGFADKSEWPEILAIYNRYPISELIVHPRLREDYYNGLADRELFAEALSSSPLKLVYNGDVYVPDDKAFTLDFDVMAGRGLLTNPALFRQVRGGAAASSDELRNYHDLLVEYYSQYMDGAGPVIHHMKSLWIYFSELFEYEEKTMKKLRKAKNLADYSAAAREILKNPK